MANIINKNRFTRSVGTGMKSLFSPKRRTYYILEHKLTSSKHNAGEQQEIIVDYIELGRGSKCQVKFDNTYGSVSRRHATILKDGNNWKLHKLSNSDETLLNGIPIINDSPLQSGDEIQFSTGGPKLSFIVPNNNRVSSIRLKRRINLFRKQALRPYKTALIMLSISLLLGVVAMGGALYHMDNKHSSEIQQIIDLSGSVSSSLLAENKPNVFFIKCTKITIKEGSGQTDSLTPVDGEDRILSGTGFLLNNGKFITARHVVEPWVFINDNDVQNGNPMVEINAYATAGADVEGHFTAYSSSGRTIDFVTSSCKVDRSKDESASVDRFEGSMPVTIAQLGSSDWAVTTVDIGGGLSYDSQLSTSLTAQTKLEVLGFPLGIGYNSPSDLEPIYGNCIVAKDGLDNELILVTDRNFEQGNSGGPVFALKNNKYYVVGLISASAGGSTGFIVPISEINM